MEKLQIRDAIRQLSGDPAEAKLFRVVHMDRAADRVILIEVRRKKRREEKRTSRSPPSKNSSRRSKRTRKGGRGDGLQERRLSDVEASLRTPSVEYVKWQSHPRMLRSEDELTLREMEIRDRDWEMIEPIVSGVNAELIFDPTRRGTLIKQRSKELKLRDLTSIYRPLRRYWEDGMIKNALLPDWVKTTGKATPRKPSKVSIGDNKSYGVNKKPQPSKKRKRITDTDRLKFKYAHKTYHCRQGKTKTAAYWLMLANEYDAGTYDERTGRFKFHSHIQLHDMPSQKQFFYFIDTKTDPIETLKKRSRGTKFDRDHRGLGGRVWQDIVGPTEEYQIDETQTPINLVSSLNPKIPLGNAWVVSVAATWVPMAVGAIVSYRSPSMALARDALFNAFTDKVEYCARYGIHITEDEWPCHHVCLRVFADRQSLLTDEAEESLTRGTLKIGIDTPERARGDLKAYIERLHGIVKTKTQSEGDPAAFPPEGLEMGERHPYFRATETVEDYTRKLLIALLRYNETLKLKAERLTKAMLADGVRPYPLDLWKWGLQNAPTSPISYTDAEIYHGLLPEGEATVTESGISFGLPNSKTKHTYTCEQAIREQWYAKARNRGTWRIKVLYDRLWANHIWILLKDGSLERCDLMPFEQATMNSRLDVITTIQDAHMQATSAEARQHIEAEIGIAKTNSETSKKAKARSKALGKGPSDRDARAAQSKNRETEINSEVQKRNDALTSTLKIKSVAAGSKDNVVQLFKSSDEDDLSLIEKLMTDAKQQR